MIDKNTIYSYFQTDDFPTEEQFRATWDSFWHKSESIPMSSITGLNQLFQQTATVAQLNDKANVDGSNIDVSAYQEKLNITNLIATAKEEVKTELLNGAPEAFDTLKEISDWISDDETAEGAILQAIQTEAAARTEADNLKLNKPTTIGNTTTYPFVVGEDGNGNPARLPAGDLGKNFFNSDLSNTTARNHTMNAGVTVNTLGNPHTLSGLPNKNADIANFRKVRVQNASGLDSVVDSKNLLTDGVTSMTDEEKDVWRLAQRKTGENYSTGQPRVDVIFPKILSKQITGVQYMSLIGINLFVNITSPTTSVTMINTSTNQEYLISNIQVSQTNQQILSFGLDFVNIPEGTYRFRVINNGLQNIDTITFTVSNADLYVTDLSNLTWAKGVANGTFASSFGDGNTAYRDSNRNSNVGSFSSRTERGLLLVSNEILNTQEANANWWIEIESIIPSTGLDYFGNTYVGIVDSSASESALQFLMPSYGLFIWGNGFSCFPENVAIASARNFSGTVKTNIIKQGSLVTLLVIINNTIYRSVTFSIITQYTGIKLMLASAVGLERTYDIDWSIINTFKLIKF